MTTTLEQLCELLDAGGLRLCFGLRQQEHFETVKTMRRRFVGWESIAREIGWADGKSVMEAFEQESDPMYEVLVKLGNEARSLRALLDAYRQKRSFDGGPGRPWHAMRHREAEELVERLEQEFAVSQQKETKVANDLGNGSKLL